MNLKIITPATTEPVSLAEAKLHLRVTADTDNTLITNLIKTARQHAENYAGRALASQTLELVLDNFPCCYVDNSPCGYIELPMPPVTSVTSVKYKNSDGIEATWDTAEYIFYDKEPAIITLAFNKSWPSFTPYPAGAVKVRYVAGYTTNIPEPIRQAMLLLIATLYENREDIIVGQPAVKLPFGVQALLYPYKIFTL